MARVYNFNAGPATLPEDVLKEIQAEFLDYKGTGISVIESSHRSAEYKAINAEAQANIKELLGLGDEFAVLFLQGGASTQFAMVPMNFASAARVPDYTNSGAWAKKAIKEAKIIAGANVIADTTEAKPAAMPDPAGLQATAGAPYVHITSNETIAGTQWKTFPKLDAPLVADMSSDILSRPIDMAPFGLIYAGAQKNLGPAGAAVVIVRKDFAESGNEGLPTMFDYRTHIEKDSAFNTPPVFAVYAVMLVTRWVKAQGGLAKMEEINKAKAAKIYDVIDGTDFFRGTAAADYRSFMNVTFNLPTEDLEAKFIAEAAEQGMKGLKGHRSVGGVRASIYNAFPAEGIDALVAFMKEFEQNNG